MVLIIFANSINFFPFYFQAQLTVTPRLEGTLKIVGVRWKLSGLIGGFYNFDSDLAKKKIAKKRRKNKRSTTDNLEFIVIKVPPFPSFILNTSACSWSFMVFPLPLLE